MEGVGGLDPAASGRVAAVIRTHHVFADGLTAGDLWPRCTHPKPTRRQRKPCADSAPPTPGTSPWTASRASRAGNRLLLSRVLPGLLLAVLTTVRRAVSSAGVMVSPFAAPPVPFNGDSTERRNVAYTGLDLAEVKCVKNAFGVKVNDVLLAVIAGALRTYLQNRAELPDKPLVALVPMSIYDESRDSRNEFAPYWSALHTDVADPVARHARRTLQHHSQGAHRRDRRGDVLEHRPVLALADRDPGCCRCRAFARCRLRRQLSNVMLTQEQILAGALTANYPFGPVMNGAGLNITATSCATTSTSG